MRTKKGESISMSVIIIAAIALLVLVVLAVLILRSGQKVGDGTGCEGKGGRCDSECNPDFETQDFVNRGTLGKCAEGQVCCVKVTRNTDDSLG